MRGTEREIVRPRRDDQGTWGTGLAKKSKNRPLSSTFVTLRDPSKGHNSVEPRGKNHKIPVSGLMPLAGRFWGKKPTE